ncbi:MAG: hypothetical protein R2795_25555 [Saprospiraceae bacterium]
MNKGHTSPLWEGYLCPVRLPQQPVFEYGQKAFLCRVVTVPTRQSIMVFYKTPATFTMDDASGRKWLAHRPNAPVTKPE